ncbi:MAG: hypothetical protein RL693_1776 [Verrucomicrobiota bacterium]|jgi:hypothetical protein
MYSSSHSDPKDLLFVGVICTSCGLILFWKASTGDTLLPGTLWTRIPTWLFWVGGLLLQLPLPLAIWFLKANGVI